jgi:hypothetical protein
MLDVPLLGSEVTPQARPEVKIEARTEPGAKPKLDRTAGQGSGYQQNQSPEDVPAHRSDPRTGQGQHLRLESPNNRDTRPSDPQPPATDYRTDYRKDRRHDRGPEHRRSHRSDRRTGQKQDRRAESQDHRTTRPADSQAHANGVPRGRPSFQNGRVAALAGRSISRESSRGCCFCFS